MDEEKIKEAFFKIKKDIAYLHYEITKLKQEIQQVESCLSRLLEQFKLFSRFSTSSAHLRQMIQGPTHKMQNQALFPKNFHSSTGNEGVPTDSQQTVNRCTTELKRTFIPELVANLKKDLQEKFKKLTKQEFFIFSLLYTLEEEKKEVTYKDIAERANLAESSVRDYISRLERKGIPIIKERLNNKIILLKISPELKSIASLEALSKLVNFSTI